MTLRSRIWQYAIGGLVAGLLLGVAWGVFRPQSTSAPTINQNANRTATANTNTATNTALTGATSFSTVDLPDRDPAFDFSAVIPTAWAVEYVAASQAINIYDPRGSGSTSLANAKIFIKYFSSTRFETLTTVDIISETATTIAGRPAVTYVIHKKNGVTNFANQPDWRNLEHRVTDVRVTDANPSIFYVFAKAPAVDEATFANFLASLKFSAPEAE